VPSLLLTIAICLLVPWLPVLVYRRLPRRPPLPPAAGQLHRLAAELQRPASGEIVEVVPGADDQPETEITRRSGSAPEPPRRRPEEPKDRDVPDAQENMEPLAILQEAVPRSLTLQAYQSLNLLFVLLLIVLFLALGAGWAYLLHLLGEEHARTFPPAVFLFKPFAYGIVFAVPALFLGIFSSMPVLVGSARLIMGRQRFLEYLYWDEGRVGQEGWSPDAIIGVVSFLALLVGILSALFACLALNWYARLTEDEIAIKRLFAFGEEVHPYDSVEQIVVTTHRRQGKETVQGEDLGLRFRDGRTWSTDQTFALPRDAAERDRLLAFLQQKTGKPITRARLLKDVPGM